MTHILVTGGAGFIGSAVTAALTAADYDVSILDSLHPAAHNGRPDLPEGVTLHHADLRDRAAVTEALAGVDAVVHQAALVGLGAGPGDLPEYVGCNDLGTAVLLAAMSEAGIGRLVLAGSMVVYGEGAYRCDQHGPVRPAPRAAADLLAGRFEPPCPECGAALTAGRVDEDTPMDPRSVYAATKVAQEHLCAVWARECGGTVAALRYHNVYGPGMPRDTPYSGVAAIFRSSLERGEAPQVYEDGGQLRDFVHVTDVAEANVAALRAVTASRSLSTGAGCPQPTDTIIENRTRMASGASPLGGRAPWGGFRAFNIASGAPATVGEMAGALADAFGGPRPEVTGRFRLGDVRHVVASPDRAAAELGFRAAVTPAAGLREFACAPLRG
ncbi:NAD-dependent epimerase/dehydratase family protein [Paractinoplanes atraurantiacus]|uniref:UDP-glucose 4-epimerase n=1 Tax=Paractinoplanes atraurantiacus TaxID=1036182 RepID=A0A285IG76_9ACTN|nr:NAD-dependent epimerase/dehydratase family protein [Actinoplanes atraurantiacus]SNY46933.1 dTDP-L-rhamnose 4-epimerase [Actinoplanes atraurantiacus]